MIRSKSFKKGKKTNTDLSTPVKATPSMVRKEMGTPKSCNKGKQVASILGPG
jgi:hypothetical protein